MQMATLAEAAPGRAALAVGIGNPLFLAESGEVPEKPVRVIREFVEALRKLWSGEPVTQAAFRFRLNGARMMFKPPTPIPIYLAPTREQMLQLAGKIGDGVVLSAGLSTDWVRQSLGHVKVGAAAAGRGPECIRTAGYILFIASSDGTRAFNLAREKLAFLFRNRALAENLSHSGVTIDQDAIITAMSRRDYPAAAKLIPDEAVSKFAVAGSIQQCCDKLDEFAAAGLDNLVLFMAGDLDDQRYGLEVIRNVTR
jgi:5,10-methylenetetrahydromethanopterin reductase